MGRLRDLRIMRAWQMEAYVGVKGGWSCGVVGYESELRMWLMPGIIWQMEFRRDMLLSRG